MACTKPIGNGCTYIFFVWSNKKVNVIYFKNSSRVPWLDSLKNSDWKTICNSFSILFLQNSWLEKLKQLRTYFNLLHFMFCTFQLLIVGTFVWENSTSFYYSTWRNLVNLNHRQHREGTALTLLGSGSEWPKDKALLLTMN